MRSTRAAARLASKHDADTVRAELVAIDRRLDGSSEITGRIVEAEVLLRGLSATIEQISDGDLEPRRALVEALVIGIVVQTRSPEGPRSRKEAVLTSERGVSDA